MGEYSELIFGARLKDDNEMITTVRQLVEHEEVSPLPAHEFFKSERYTQIARGTNSYYFAGSSEPTFYYDHIVKEWTLLIRMNMKDYDNEIEKFLDWIKPYITQGSGNNNMYAIVMHEWNTEPIMYYIEDIEGE